MRIRVYEIPAAAERVLGRPVRTAAVVVAGTMGAGIAMTFANAGSGVTLIDAAPEALARAATAIGETYAARLLPLRARQPDSATRPGNRTAHRKGSIRCAVTPRSPKSIGS
jgi:3-hydroxyacyl-CoA dehydrogenase